MFSEKEKYNIDDLLKIVKTLRAPEGCPWDKAQTHESVRNNLLEEAYEVVEAIDNKDSTLLKEELGDLLLQVVMLSQMEDEAGEFRFDDVCDGICKKLIFRHPHVFGEIKADSPKQALSTWEEMKKIEKGQKTATDTLTSVAKTLPALMYTQKIQGRASKQGYDYTDINGALKDLHSELEELMLGVEKKDPDNIHEELGDLLFSVVNVSRFLNVDSEKALLDSNAKFVERFRIVEDLTNQRGISVSDISADEFSTLWSEAKNIQNQHYFGGIINDKS